MNYMRPDPFKQTSCKDCIFAIYDDKTQIGCEDDRINKFKDSVIEAYDDDKEFYVIDRICNLHRKKTWNNGQKSITKAKNESALTFDLLIDCENINSNYEKNIVEELCDISYPNNKINIFLFHSHKVSKEQKKLVMSLHSKLNKSKISVYFDKIDYIYSILTQSKNTFHMFVNEHNIENLANFLIVSNNLITNDLEKFILCSQDNKMLISNIAFKFLYPNLYNDFENEIKNLKENARKENMYIEL